MTFGILLFSVAPPPLYHFFPFTLFLSFIYTPRTVVSNLYFNFSRRWFWSIFFKSFIWFPHAFVTFSCCFQPSFQSERITGFHVLFFLSFCTKAGSLSSNKHRRWKTILQRFVMKAFHIFCWKTKELKWKRSYLL